jgi:hypothetical protein
MDSFLTQDVAPSQVGGRLLRRWPIIVVISVVGGLFGLAADWMLPPTYQASASLAVGVDPNLAEPYSKNVRYEANLRTQDLFLSDLSLEAARSQLAPSLAGSSVGAFRTDLRLDNIDDTWYLRAKARSPSDAAVRANAWASAAASQFKAAQGHALKAGELQALLFSVACKPEKVIAQGGSSLWACDEMSLDINPDQVSSELLAEARLSHGILPGLSITEIHEAALPSQPTRQARALFALGGVIVGLVLGLLAALSDRQWLGWIPQK